MKTNTRRLRSARLPAALLALLALAVLGACGHRPLAAYNTQLDLPESVRVPPGHQVVLDAKGSGELLYECQAVKRAPYEYAWLLRNTRIELTDSYGNSIVQTPGLRTTWVHRDGSRVAARELSELTLDSNSLPLQRLKADRSGSEPGLLQDVSYIQRLRTVGGVPSAKPCRAAELGMRMRIPYEADYVFWRPAA